MTTSQSSSSSLKAVSNPQTVIAKGKQLGLKIEPSHRKDKKYMVKINNKTIHFGAAGYQDYTKHKDEQRRQRFRQRNAKWRSAAPDSAGWLAYHILW